LTHRIWAGADHVAVRAVPGAADLALAVRGPQAAGDHVPLSQGSGLVRTQDRHRPQRLHRGQPPDQRVARRHPPGSQRQRERQHRGQRLRDGRDDQADRGDHHQLHALAPGQPDRQHDGAQRHRHHRQHPADTGQPPLQRGEPGLGPQQRRDPPHRASRPGGPHHRPATAAHHHRASRHAACPVRPGRDLLHRNRLAGQRGLIHQQRRGIDHAGIGGHDITLGQHQHIPHDHLSRRDLPLLAIAHHPGLRGSQVRQRRDRLARLDLLNDPTVVFTTITSTMTDASARSPVATVSTTAASSTRISGSRN
jgi:hypothetical protein